MSPMVTRFATPDGRVTEKMIRYYAERARGGVAMIVAEATYPCLYRTPGRLYIYSDEFIPGLKRLTGAIHDEGVKIALQLNPSRGREDSEDPVSASDVPSPAGGPRPRPLRVEEIERVVADFGAGVARAREAGFDAIEIHGAGGYLVGQFLSPYSNKRQDEYGGSLQGRARLALELLKTARDKLGPGYPILYKLCVEEHLPGGFSVEEAAVVSRWMEENGADALDVISGVYGTLYHAIPPMSMPPGCNADFAKTLKAKLRIPVCVSGKIRDPALAEEILAQEKADFLMLGRALLADPLWPEKARQGRWKEILRCIACNRCLENIIKLQSPLACSVNPELGSEEKKKTRPRVKSKKILVVGGGPAGMQASITSARQGHRAMLWEEKGVLGGNLLSASAPSFKRGISDLTNDLAQEMKRAGVEVRLRTRGTGETILAEKPDLVIVATGSSPWLPPIPGIDRREVATAVSVLEGDVPKTSRAVVVGGGMIGCEVAAFLREKGREVKLVTRRDMDSLANDMEPVYRLWFFRRLWPGLGVEIIPKSRCQAVVDGGVLVEQGQTTCLIEGEAVIFAAGMVPNTEIPVALREKSCPMVVVGDCLEPRKIYDAIHSGAAALASLG